MISQTVTLTDIFGLDPIFRLVSIRGYGRLFGMLGLEVVTSLLTFGKSIDEVVTATYS